METYMVALLWIMALIVVGLIFWLIIVIFSSREKHEDRDFCFSFMSNRHGLRAYGDVLDIIPGVGGRKTIVMQPKDINPSTILKGVKISPINIIVDNNHEIIFPKGKHSKDKNIHMPLPATASELSKEFLDTPFGKFMAFYIEFINSRNTAIDSLKKGLEWSKEHLKEMGWGEVSVSRMNQLRDIFDEALEAQLSTKKDKTHSIITDTNPSERG